MAQNMMTMNRDDLLELKKRMENALDNDLLEDESFDINEFEEEVCTMEQDLEDYLPAARSSERKLITNILQLIAKVKDEYEFSMQQQNAERYSLTGRMITDRVRKSKLTHFTFFPYRRKDTATTRLIAIFLVRLSRPIVSSKETRH